MLYLIQIVSSPSGCSITGNMIELILKGQRQTRQIRHMTAPCASTVNLWCLSCVANNNQSIHCILPNVSIPGQFYCITASESSCLEEEGPHFMSLALAMAHALVTLPTNSNGTSGKTNNDPSHLSLSTLLPPFFAHRSCATLFPRTLHTYRASLASIARSSSKPKTNALPFILFCIHISVFFEAGLTSMKLRSPCSL